MFLNVVPFYTLFMLVTIIKCDTSGAKVSRALENKLRSILEKWRLGDEITPGLRFPSLQIFRIGSVDGKYRSTGAEIYYYATGIAVFGLNRFIIEKLEASEYNGSLETSVIIRIPYVHIYASRYMINGRVLFVVPISTRGNVTVTFKNVRLYSAIQLVKFENVPGLRVGGCGFDFEFDDVLSDLVDDQSLNKIINNESANIIDRNRENIIGAVRIKVIDYANEYLKSMTKVKLLKVRKNSEKKM